MTDSAPTSRPLPARVSTARRVQSRPVVLPGNRTPTATKRTRLLAILAAVVLFLVLANELSGLNNLRDHPIQGSDYIKVSQFVAERQKPGEPVFVAIPPPAYLALGSRNDLVFVSSPFDRVRAQRYTRLTSNSEYVDYWTGSPSIVSTGQLCQAMLSSPNLWFIVDGARLNADWAYLGDMQTVIEGLTYIRYYDPSGSMVRRLAPIPARDPVAEKLCAKEMAKLPNATTP